MVTEGCGRRGVPAPGCVCVDVLAGGGVVVEADGGGGTCRTTGHPQGPHARDPPGAHMGQGGTMRVVIACTVNFAAIRTRRIRALRHRLPFRAEIRASRDLCRRPRMANGRPAARPRGCTRRPRAAGFSKGADSPVTALICLQGGSWRPMDDGSRLLIGVPA
jgi:hypothetical protein